jgi:SAM-dependent methyltransferase
MDEKSREMIRTIKAKVIGMLEERQRLQTEEIEVVSPSKIWSDACSFFDYMLWLPEESFSKLRLHTYHLTGDNYLTYYHKKGVESFRDVWEELIEGIPWHYVLYEPEGGIGFPAGNGKSVSHDILRFQKVVNTLYRHGIISSIVNANMKRKVVLEIGAGYGGLGHHLAKILGNVTYIIVDLPETLLFSASYLSLLNPDKRIFINERTAFSESVCSDVITSSDFVLIPNYKIDELRHLRFDLVINVSSLQEMRSDQVNMYLDFIAKTCRGVFYTWNQDAHPMNAELSSLSEMLKTRFELTEVVIRQPVKRLTRKDKVRLKLKRVLKSVAILMGLLEQPREGTPDCPYREYICKPLMDKVSR